MIAIINYNAGNVRSVQNALNKLGAESIITNDPDIIRSSGKVIFPGVGHAQSAMEALKRYNLEILIKELTQPVLGICLGMQLMCLHSEEGDTDCLGIFKTAVRKFPETGIVPHMGWNELEIQNDTGILKNVGASDDVYFVHGYYAELCDNTTSICNYLEPFSATLEFRNFYATQFHPEKSGRPGEQILKNFLEL